jgi:hypothetical protein
MPQYTVTWEIEIHAETPEEAAREALAIQRDVNSTATVFHLCDEGGEACHIDLMEIDESQTPATGGN